VKIVKTLLAASVLLALVGGAGRLQADPVNATVFSVTGTAEFAPPDSVSFKPLKVGQVLLIGSTVRTGDTGKVVLQTTPGSAVELGINSILKLNELAFQKKDGAVVQRKVRIELTSGVVNALIDPSTPKTTDFKIQTPEGALVARGTFYTVEVRNGKTYATVKEGKISAIARPTRGSI